MNELVVGRVGLAPQQGCPAVDPALPSALFLACTLVTLAASYKRPVIEEGNKDYV